MDFLSEEELLNLTPKELEKEANKYLFNNDFSSKISHPYLKGSRVKTLKRREILMAPEDLRKFVNGDWVDFNPLYYKELKAK